jgi:hypothetical protein
VSLVCCIEGPGDDHVVIVATLRIRQPGLLERHPKTVLIERMSGVILMKINGIPLKL